MYLKGPGFQIIPNVNGLTWSSQKLNDNLLFLLRLKTDITIVEIQHAANEKCYLLCGCSSWSCLNYSLDAKIKEIQEKRCGKKKTVHAKLTKQHSRWWWGSCWYPQGDPVMFLSWSKQRIEEHGSMDPAPFRRPLPRHASPAALFIAAWRKRSPCPSTVLDGRSSIPGAWYSSCSFVG